ncbi:PI-PLC X domain-containing protein 1 [Puma concolor]|uniref:PI-PLC X domain-containing protein 1 n=1 Tax=Puma concolor TaxID=9696 RepID=A0A6P6H3M3_PUMCO|nr:PI-PLC X domain-containing protein 1 [Puma concolor]
MGGQVSASGNFQSCSTNADWMSALCPLLWDVPLHHLSIPGSHDTMTYCLDKKSPIAQSQSRLLQLLGKILPCITRPIVLKWSTTQVRGAGPWGRPISAICRVAPFSLVQDTLTEISEWLESHPQEVVILACRDFDGLTDNLHEYLVACINNIFGDMLCPRGEVPTLNQLWTRGQQVILSYEEASVVSRHRELWPGIPYWWGDQVKPQDLIHYLEHMKRCGRPGGLFVAGINLTENLTCLPGALFEPVWARTRDGQLGAHPGRCCGIPGPAGRPPSGIPGN